MRKLALSIVIAAIIVLLLWPPGAPEPTAPQATVPGSSRLSELLGGDGADAYPQALEPREFRFPADHGPHPKYRNEWWYVTGNLDSDAGSRLGFELTLFRFALAPEVSSDASAWRTNQVYIGHFAITDAANEAFHVRQRYARGSLGLAGAETDPLKVWVEDWQLGEVTDASARPGERPWRLRAADAELAVDLTLEPLKAPVLNGERGLSRKSDEPGNASYYYSITRLKTGGTVRIGEESHSVSGQSWLDREWGSSALARDQAGWDWFALQLDDQSELMFYNLRKLDGSRDAMSAGTFVSPDGVTTHLERDDVAIEVLDHWDSPAGGRYPIRWRLEAPRLALSLMIEPVIEAQELVTTVRYWEGAVDVSGRVSGGPVAGRGYVELTGYADSETAL